MKTVGIITARGGSKRFPRKNIAPLCGKPLIGYTIEASLHCPLIDQTWVTTDDEEIMSVARSYDVNLIERPDELSQDNSTSYDTVVHALELMKAQGHEFDYFVLLQPTSPMRNSEHLAQAIEQVGTDGAKSVVSVCPTEHSPYKSFVRNGSFLEPLFDKSRINLPAQALPEVYRQNGAIYVIPVNDFLTGEKNFFVEPVAPFNMDSLASMDVDTELDLKIVESVMQWQSEAGNEKFIQ
jgi:CMP-N,N'-diacetyllegionaminic acid synthase